MVNGYGCPRVRAWSLQQTRTDTRRGNPVDPKETTDACSSIVTWTIRRASSRRDATASATLYARNVRSCIIDILMSFTLFIDNRGDKSNAFNEPLNAKVSFIRENFYVA
ncbi:hypothetical protein ACS0PU_002174 [Formica fusca]